MFGQSVVRSSRLVQNVRYFRCNATLRNTKEGVGSVAQTAAKPAAKVDPETVLGAKMHRCNNFDRWLLVWVKKFPSKDKVPDKVTVDLLHKAQSQGRIRTANIMMVLTIIGCIWAVTSGKKDFKAGKSMAQQNQDWHAQINKEYRESLAAAKPT